MSDTIDTTNYQIVMQVLLATILVRQDAMRVRSDFPSSLHDALSPVRSSVLAVVTFLSVQSSLFGANYEVHALYVTVISELGHKSTPVPSRMQISSKRGDILLLICTFTCRDDIVRELLPSLNGLVMVLLC